jgi:hypothetical protein
MKKIISFVILTGFLISNSVYSMSLDSNDTLRVPLSSKEQTGNGDSTRVISAYTLEEIREMIKKKLKESNIEITPNGISKGDKFLKGRDPSVQISSAQFDKAIHEASKILNIHTDFKIIYKAPSIRKTGEKRYYEEDEEEYTAYIMHGQYKGIPDFHEQPEYVIKTPSRIKIIPSGKLRAKELIIQKLKEKGITTAKEKTIQKAANKATKILKKGGSFDITYTAPILIREEKFDEEAFYKALEEELDFGEIAPEIDKEPFYGEVMVELFPERIEMIPIKAKQRNYEPLIVMFKNWFGRRGKGKTRDDI